MACNHRTWLSGLEPLFAVEDHCAGMIAFLNGLMGTPPPSPFENGAVDRFSLIVANFSLKGTLYERKQSLARLSKIPCMKKGWVLGLQMLHLRLTPAALVQGGRSQISLQCGCSCRCYQWL